MVWTGLHLPEPELKLSLSQEELFRSLLENAADVITVLDGDGTIRFQSRSIGPSLGYDPDESVGRPISEFVHREDLNAVRAHLSRAVAHPGELVATTARFRRRDGSWALLEGTGRAWQDSSGEVRVVATWRDVTARRAQDTALRHLVHQLGALESIVRRSPAMVLLWSAAPDWPVEYASDNVRQLGYEPDDFISGRVSWPGITHPEDAPRLAAELKDYASRGITEFTQHYRVFRKSGETVWVEDLTRALVDSAGRITRYQGILLDVTARHRAEQELAQLVALRTAEAKEGWQNLRTFLDAVATPALLLEEDGTILLANRAAASRFNTNPLAVNGRSVYTFFAPEDASRRRAAVERVLRSRAAVTFEEERGGHVMRHTVQPVTEGAARPRRVAVLAVDITEQRRSEQALRKNERLLRDVFDALPDGISVLDRDLTILRTNAVMERTYKDRLPLAGRKCHEVYQLRSAPCQWCPAQEVIRTGRPASAVVPCASSDAATGWIELTALPLLDDRGDVSAVIERTSDVTGSTREWAELKHRCETLEALVRERTDELRRAQDSLTRKERLALLGQFSAGIVDELHGPLSVIRNAAYYLQLTQTGNLQGKGLRHIEMIREAVKQCDALSRNVLEYARGRPPSIKRCGIGELMRKTAGQLALPPGVELTLALPDDLPAALADEFQLGRVIDNLLANAAQALTRGGKVTAAATAGRDTVNISVTDNGPGIASDDLPHIFDPLYSTKAFGAGLSLAVCRLLVEANNGTISVRSRPGKGTTFSITLPAAQS